MADDPLPGLPPREALEFLEAKGLRPGWSWLDVWGEEHAHEFTVAKMMQADLLADTHRSLVTALAEGQTYETWAKDLTPRLQAAGWWGRQESTDPLTGETRTVQLGSPRRLRTIYDANMRSARAAGHWDRIERAMERERSRGRTLYLRYVAVLDERTRERHRRWHGLVRPADDPIWRVLYPPNGWHCRCTVMVLTERDLARYGYTPTPDDKVPPLNARPFLNHRTGEITLVPEGVDPGWHSNAGLARAETLARQAAARWATLPPDAAALAAVTGRQVRAALSDSVAGWVDDVAARGQARGERRVVGWMSERVVERLAALGRHPSSVALHLDDGIVWHMIRDAKAARGAALAVEDVRRIVDIVATPQAVLYDHTDPALLYVFEPTGDAMDRLGKLIVRIDWRTNVRTPEGRAQVTLNAIRSGGLVRSDNLDERTPDGERRYAVLDGSLEG
ncbi:phage minor head protein [Roseospira goensis]|uniref:SPP1 gp7 family putative phage head morphogenesis protein n=1 Tax=Roseospira goensis TaxID=391922 RepID=A0A7W6WM76_9PROT|nr:phage minor head protein [Roseospira goensis]MBB4287790.1 SPP1 gp7 family putative phage head morphogenesis protein [Roseospira goensis]